VDSYEKFVNGAGTGMKRLLEYPIPISYEGAFVITENYPPTCLVFSHIFTHI
jgi:hypothetical protein